MPVYVFPELLETISPELKKRMQGKSCFNFKVVDETLLSELRELTKAGYTQYANNGYLWAQVLILSCKFNAFSLLINFAAAIIWVIVFIALKNVQKASEPNGNVASSK